MFVDARSVVPHYAIGKRFIEEQRLVVRTGVVDYDPVFSRWTLTTGLFAVPHLLTANEQKLVIRNWNGIKPRSQRTQSPLCVLKHEVRATLVDTLSARLG